MDSATIDAKLKKIEASGGPSVTLCDAPVGAPSGSWGSQHSILFASLGARALLARSRRKMAS